jgi:hypothetical protein
VAWRAFDEIGPPVFAISVGAALAVMVADIAAKAAPKKVAQGADFSVAELTNS